MENFNMKSNIAVAVSGAGRSLKNLIRHQERSSYHIKAIISSTRGCGAEDIAHQNDIDIIPFTKKSDLLQIQLQELNIDWILLAGFIKKFPILTSYEKKTINIHPSLLPKYGGKGMYGIRVHEAVFSAKETISGATIHQISDEYDQGPIIAQESVDISQAKSPQDIAQLVFQVECNLYPATLEKLIEKNFKHQP